MGSEIDKLRRKAGIIGIDVDVLIAEIKNQMGAEVTRRIALEKAGIIAEVRQIVRDEIQAESLRKLDALLEVNHGR